jgi:hypothetical protein
VKPDYDITFDVDNLRFRYRIAGIVLHNGKILLQQVKGLDYWFLPRGKVRAG